MKNITRPMRILFTEPIVLLITLYMSFIYGLLYLNLTAYALVFQQVYGFSLGVAGIPYMALIVGVMVGFLIIVLMNGSYVKKLEANNNIPVPEWRLPIAGIGGIVFACGLFWFGKRTVNIPVTSSMLTDDSFTGWGGYMSSTPWIVPTLAGLFLGFGIFTVFIQCLNYIIDAYLMFAASAIAANTIMRSIFGAVFPLFATYMFQGMGIQWAMTFLGFVAALFIPMPFLFIKVRHLIKYWMMFAPQTSTDTVDSMASASEPGRSSLRPSMCSRTRNETRSLRPVARRVPLARALRPTSRGRRKWNNDGMLLYSRALLY